MTTANFSSTANVELAGQARLIAALRRPDACAHDTGHVRLIETHISYILLAGSHAYKIKKAVNLGFLDFTTLEQRRFYCEEELRLNRRTAPSLYQAVLPVTGSLDSPRFGGAGPALEYAILMTRFPQEARLDHVLADGGLNAAIIDALALWIADFHRQIAVADASHPYGTASAVAAPAVQNLQQITVLLHDAASRTLVGRHARWLAGMHRQLAPRFTRRRAEGFVRECHGDLHLGNIVLLDGRPTPFDCIEFNPQLRWIDVINEIAFVMMDLQVAGKPGWSWRLLDRYLAETGDYGGIRLLPYYLAYRAMVRAKIELMGAAQTAAAAARPPESAARYLRLADAWAGNRRPAIVLACGYSGSGKTTLSQPLLEQLGAVRLRSDVERKRLHALQPLARTRSPVDGNLYSDDATRATYEYLLDLTDEMAEAGMTVIVDACFLKRWQRDAFRQLARRLHASFAIIHFRADPALLKGRICARVAAGADASDADIAVLEHQMGGWEPFTTDEQDHVVAYDAALPLDAASRPVTWHALRERLAAQS